MYNDEESRKLREHLDSKITLAAKLIDAGKYDQFEKMNFSDIEKMNADDIGIKPSEWPFEVMDKVETLSGLNYMVEKGLIGDDYFKSRTAIAASSEQLDYYVKSGADVNFTLTTYSFYHNTQQKVSFLDHIMLNDSYSAENVESVVKAGGMSRMGYFDVFSFTENLRRWSSHDEKDVYGPNDVIFGNNHPLQVENYEINQKNLEEKISVLNKYGYLEKYDREILMKYPFSDGLKYELKHSDKPDLDPLEIKQKRLEADMGRFLGKTGDSTTGKTFSDIAKRQCHLAKDIMLIKRYKEGKLK